MYSWMTTAHISTVASLPSTTTSHSATLEVRLPNDPDGFNAGLIAHYPFDGNANDSSGNANHGTPVNVVFGNNGFGENRRMAQFEDGSSVTVNSQNLPKGNSPRTMSCYVMITGAAAGTESFIAGWGDTSINESFSFFGDAFDTAPGSNGFLAWSQGDSSVPFTGADVAKQNQWYHLIATYDGETITTYLDGVKVQTGSFNLNTGNGNLIIGDLGGHRILDGGVDELRIYSRALSDLEATHLYNLETPSPIINEPVPSQHVRVGDDVTISVDANGTALTYQWQKKDAQGNWVNIDGANSYNYTITNSTPVDSGVYRVRNATGKVATALKALFMSKETACTSDNPKSLNAAPDTVHFEVNAAGLTSRSISGRWRRLQERTLMIMRASSSLTLADVQLAQNDTVYRVRVKAPKAKFTTMPLQVGYG